MKTSNNPALVVKTLRETAVYGPLTRIASLLAAGLIRQRRPWLLTFQVCLSSTSPFNGRAALGLRLGNLDT